MNFHETDMFTVLNKRLTESWNFTALDYL